MSVKKNKSLKDILKKENPRTRSSLSKSKGKTPTKHNHNDNHNGSSKNSKEKKQDERASSDKKVEELAAFVKSSKLKELEREKEAKLEKQKEPIVIESEGSVKLSLEESLENEKPIEDYGEGVSPHVRGKEDMWNCATCSHANPVWNDYMMRTKMQSCSLCSTPKKTMSGSGDSLQSRVTQLSQLEEEDKSFVVPETKTERQQMESKVKAVIQPSKLAKSEVDLALKAAMKAYDSTTFKALMSTLLHVVEGREVLVPASFSGSQGASESQIGSNTPDPDSLQFVEGTQTTTTKPVAYLVGTVDSLPVIPLFQHPYSVTFERDVAALKDDAPLVKGVVEVKGNIAVCKLRQVLKLHTVISKKHAKLTVQQDGTFVLQDTSVNGTAINKKKMTKVPEEVQMGDVISISNAEWKLQKTVLLGEEQVDPVAASIRHNEVLVKEEKKNGKRERQEKNDDEEGGVSGKGKKTKKEDVVVKEKKAKAIVKKEPSKSRKRKAKEEVVEEVREDQVESIRRLASMRKKNSSSMTNSNFINLTLDEENPTTRRKKPGEGSILSFSCSVANEAPKEEKREQKVEEKQNVVVDSSGVVLEDKDDDAPFSLFSEIAVEDEEQPVFQSRRVSK